MANETKPFPFPVGYEFDLSHKMVDRSIRDYISIFEQRRNERPGGKFAGADIQEIMRLAEDLESVDTAEVDCLFELITLHPDYFKDEAQRLELQTFARNHDALLKAFKDEFVKDLVAVAPVQLFRGAAGQDFLARAQALSVTLKANEEFHALHGMFDPALLTEANRIAGQLRQLVAGLTLSDVDHPGRDAIDAYWRDLENLLARPFGETHHESEWKDGVWSNWNRDVAVYPERYETPGSLALLCALLKQRPGPFRMAAGGHAFNISSSMGGTKGRPIGTLVTLDQYHLDGGQSWRRVAPNEAITKYKVSADQATRVVKVSAGMRLRDFGKAMWNEGMALPVAGSTDAQSLGGLIATDLHGTGKFAGFLSTQLLELTALNGSGEPVTFTKDESVPRGTPGRWKYIPPGEAAPQNLARLPVSGALGMTGIVAEIVLKLDVKYNLYKTERFVPREWAEQNIERLLDPAETDPIFAYDHVSFYYAAGDGEPIHTVRLNGWKRTTQELTRGFEGYKTIREIIDLVGSGFLPNYLLRLERRQSTVPGQQPGPNDDNWLATLNKRMPLILPANEAFARKLYFQHDEIEEGIPLPRKPNGSINYDVFREAIKDTLLLLAEEEFKTVIEIRFTPDVSEAMLGPGTGSPTCYIELATAFGDYSKARIVEVYDLFDRLIRTKYRARPHLGKKTSVDYQHMEALYGQTWYDFQNVRSKMDPANRFLPEGNVFLNRIFKEPV